MTDKPCPEFLKPRLRLFLSADIIGSTALKQSKLVSREADQGLGTAWFTVIQGFYFEAQQHLKSSWKDAMSECEDVNYFGPPPSLWKTIGDEVLFTKLITDHRQVATTLQCWMRTLDGIRAFLSKEGKGLGVKSAAWMAGFPYRNKEVVLSGEAFSSDIVIDDYYKENGAILNGYYSGNAVDVNVDYIGPHIDTGFRLAGHASARKFVVSLEIAYIMSLTSQTRASPIEPIKLRYDGQIALRGVLGGTSYPLFWLDLAKADSSAVLEDRLTKSHACDRDEVRDFCEAFYSQHSELIFPPFVEAANETTLKDKPSWYQKQHDALVSAFYEAQEESAEPINDDQVMPDSEFEEKVTDLELAVGKIGEIN